MRLTICLIIFICASIVLPSVAFTTAKQEMVVSENYLATQIGADILRAGGNAIDAAVAIGYALAVVNPCCGNIGGGGFFTIHLANGKVIFLNFRETAPKNASKTMYLAHDGSLMPNASTKGYLAVAVPGTVLGFDTALQKYGRLSRQEVMAPAIKLANDGYIVTPYEAKLFAKFAPDFREQPNIASIFLRNGQPYRAGERLVQADLAKTLTAIAETGSSVFYKGDIAKAIVSASNVHGGILTLRDFVDYKVETLSPIHCTYRGYDIFSSPPPSSGGVTLCEMLNILENFPLDKIAPQSAESKRLIIEAMRYGFVDRNTKLGDPDFITNPVAELTSKRYARHLSRAILSKKKAPKFKPFTTHPELTDTTHYSVVDKFGNAVAATYTINGFFGARVIADHTGFFLNDEMDDFTTKPGTANKFGLVQTNANAIQAGKRPLSSMTPTIVSKNGKVIMVLGSPGGPRIITAILLTLINTLDYKMKLDDAINAPRFHYQGQPDTVDVEPHALSDTVIKQLEAAGYHFTQTGAWGAVEAIMLDPTTGFMQGGSDHRRADGLAYGR